MASSERAASASDWARLLEAVIMQREVHLEQLQLFTTGAIRHPALVDKEGALLRARFLFARVSAAAQSNTLATPPRFDL